MKRLIHNLEQGSAQWHDFRANHFGASEASAMLDISPYKKRSELLKEKATGVVKEVDSFTQGIFDKGHAVEVLAREIVSSALGINLVPVVMSLGNISASLDGADMIDNDYETITMVWECKQYNASLYESVKLDILPDHHWPQCQQALYVSGADTLIFTCSDGTPEKTVSMEVYPDKSYQNKLIHGWAQFEADLANYQLVEPVSKATKEVIKGLPAITVQVRGELTLCNLNDVIPLFDKFLFEAKTELITDDDFAQAEAEAKLGRETAKRCKLTAKSVVDQMLSISEVTRTLEEYAAKFDALALKQEKAVKEQKEHRKTTAKLERDKVYSDHIFAINAELSPVFLVLSQEDKPDFIKAMKGQSKLTSVYNKLDAELARAKIAADVAAKEVRGKCALIDEHKDYKFLFNDKQQLVYKDLDDLKLVIDTRIEAHKKAESEKLELERQRIRDEEQRKAEAAKQAELARIDYERKINELKAERESEKAKEPAVVPSNDPVTKSVMNIVNIKPSQMPERTALVDTIAKEYSVSLTVAESWLITRFGSIDSAA